MAKYMMTALFILMGYAFSWFCSTVEATNPWWHFPTFLMLFFIMAGSLIAAIFYWSDWHNERSKDKLNLKE